MALDPEPRPLTSVEVRWFIRAEDAPASLDAWILAEWSAQAKRSPQEETRTDSYLVLAETDVGVKKRGQAQLEVKYRREPRQLRSFGRHAGHIERWKKWAVDHLDPSTLPLEVASKVQERSVRVDVTKTRWLRRLVVDPDAPIRELPPDRWVERAVGVELTRLAVRQQHWWSVGFEAFPDDEPVRNAFSVTVTRVLDPLRSIALAAPASMAYPEWLARMLNAEC